MKFDPSKYVENVTLLPEGIYKYEVIMAQDYIPELYEEEKILLTLKIVPIPFMEIVIIEDELNPLNLKKLRSFCESNDLYKEYHDGNITAVMCLGKSNYIKLGIKKGEITECGNGKYTDKNIVLSYTNWDGYFGAERPLLLIFIVLFYLLIRQ